MQNQEELKIKEIEAYKNLALYNNWVCINKNIGTITLIEFILKTAWSFKSSELFGGAVIDLIKRRNAVREFCSNRNYICSFEDLFNPTIDNIYWKERSILPNDLDLFFYNTNDMISFLKILISKNLGIYLKTKTNSGLNIRDLSKKLRLFDNFLCSLNKEEIDKSLTLLNQISCSCYLSTSYYASKILKTLFITIEINPLSVFHNIGMVKLNKITNNSILVNIDLTYSIINIEGLIDRKYIAPYPNYLKTLKITSFEELDDIQFVKNVAKSSTHSTLSDFFQFEPFLKKILDDNKIDYDKNKNINLKEYINRFNKELNDGWIFEDTKISNSNIDYKYISKNLKINIGPCKLNSCKKCTDYLKIIDTNNIKKESLTFKFCNNDITFILFNNFVKIELKDNLMICELNNLIFHLNLENNLSDEFLQIIYSLNCLFFTPELFAIIDKNEFITYYKKKQEEYFNKFLDIEL